MFLSLLMCSTIQPLALSQVPETPVQRLTDSASRPDIYYIIPDGYPSDSWLLDAMNYDNSEFTKALEERGFTVVKHTQSNYGATLVSLASILNMQYFDSNPSPYTDLDYLRMSIARIVKLSRGNSNSLVTPLYSFCQVI